jgi:hypothetical protein
MNIRYFKDSGTSRDPLHIPDTSANYYCKDMAWVIAVKDASPTWLAIGLEEITEAEAGVISNGLFPMPTPQPLPF